MFFKKKKKGDVTPIQPYVALKFMFDEEKKDIYELPFRCANCGHKQSVIIPKYFAIKELYACSCSSKFPYGQCIESPTFERYMLPNCESCGCCCLKKNI